MTLLRTLATAAMPMKLRHNGSRPDIVAVANSEEPYYAAMKAGSLRKGAAGASSLICGAICGVEESSVAAPYAQDRCLDGVAEAPAAAEPRPKAYKYSPMLRLVQ